MSIVTINDVRRAVIATLGKQFPMIKVYGEEIEQGFEAPAFFVKLLSASHTKELGPRYMRTHSFDVHYFPLDGQNEDAHDMAEKLYEALEVIEYNGVQYRGTNMNHEIVDSVLHFFVDYNVYVRRITPEVPMMQNMEQEGYIK
jgi:hypothetical protein